MTTIIHSLPHHNFIAIIQPHSGKGYHKIIKEREFQVYELKDPKNGEIHKAKFIDLWIIDLATLDNHNCFFLLCFGQPASKMAMFMKQKFPELQAYDSKVEIWLMEKL